MATHPPRDRSAHSSKILSAEALIQRRAEARARGQTVVQCHGCFDIVHPGHVRHLQQAARHGDVLLVTVSADHGVAKGPGRPLFTEDLRAENLAALDCVDWVHIDRSLTAADLLERVRPDVYIKGREYESNRDPRFAAERAAVERCGGRVVFTSGDVVFSSSAIVAALSETADPHLSRVRELVRRINLTPRRLDELLARFAGRRIAVVGEAILDTYIFCDRPEVAGESPVLTLRPVERRRFDGGACIVARHLAALGARPVLVTALPPTPAAAALRERLFLEGVETRAVEVEQPIVEKQRFLVGQQKVMKVDVAEPIELDSAGAERFVATAAEACAGAEAAIIADFGQGLFSPTCMQRMCAALRPRVRVLAGDVSGRRSNLLHFHGADLLCPSESELRDAARDFSSGVSAVAWRLMQRTATRSLLVTMGADGLVTFDRLPGADADPADWRTRMASEHVPALSPFAIDPLGCGDALLATATLALVAGAFLPEAAALGALAAGAQAQRLGNVVIAPEDLRRMLESVEAGRLSVVRSAALPAAV